MLARHALKRRDPEGALGASTASIGRAASAGSWLGNLDSNQDKQSQSLLCYRYTIPQETIISKYIQLLKIMLGQLLAAGQAKSRQSVRRSTR